MHKQAKLVVGERGRCEQIGIERWSECLSKRLSEYQQSYPNPFLPYLNASCSDPSKCSVRRAECARSTWGQPQILIRVYANIQRPFVCGSSSSSQISNPPPTNRAAASVSRHRIYSLSIFLFNSLSFVIPLISISLVSCDCTQKITITVTSVIERKKKKKGLGFRKLGERRREYVQVWTRTLLPHSAERGIVC
jgi:hypothetical protein